MSQGNDAALATGDGILRILLYVLHPSEQDLVMIDGGIGITPIMAMIRHMHDTQADREVLLLDANRTEQDIVFRRELDEIASSGHPRLSVLHVLSRADESWNGPRGHIPWFRAPGW